MLRSDLCNFRDAYIVVKGNIIVNKKTADDIAEPNNTPDNVTATNNANNNNVVERNWFLKTMLHLSIVFQKLIV